MACERVLLAVLVALAAAVAHAKHGRALHTDAEMAQLRANVEQHEWARVSVQRALAQAEPWAKLSDQELWDLFPSAAVPRAVHVNTEQGCPVHGLKVFEGRGFYPWRWSPNQPFRLQCPVGGEWYPSNDYAAAYRTSGDKGVKGQVDTRQPFNDDGWGYVDADGHRYWFVAYYNQWRWHDLRVVPQYLGRAYLLTGDARYAHKCAVALARLAAIYPDMDYAHQSDTGMEGRILYGQWETNTVAPMAEPYDDIYPYPAESGDAALAAFLREKSIPDLRIHVEQHLLQEFAKSLVTNTQMTPGINGANDTAMALLAVVWNDDDPAKGMTTSQMLDWAWRGVGWNAESLIHNDLTREGFECEEGLGYNFSTMPQLLRLAWLFERAGRPIWNEPKLRKMCDAPLDVTVLGRFSPAMGDSGGLPSLGRLMWGDPCYLTAFRAWGDPRYARAAQPERRDDRSLFEPDPEERIDAALRRCPDAGRHSSRDFPDFGLSILERRQGDLGRAATLWYGTSGGGHSHRDRLNVELFALDHSLAPDLGYPEHWSSSRTRYWIFNTVSHNTVVVDAKGQPQGGWGDPGGGYLALSQRLPDFDVVEGDGAAAYRGMVSEYRRLLALADLAPDRSYLLDIFRVTGGRQHDYSFHSAHAEFRLEGAALSPRQPGTVAGPTVLLGEDYDGKESGFQFLYNPQQASPPGRWSADWQLRDTVDHLRLTMLPGGAQRVIVADGDPPWKTGGALKYLLARNQGEQLRSTYAAVLEPYRGQPFLTQIERLPCPAAGPQFVALTVGDGVRTHTWLSSPEADSARRLQLPAGLTFSGRLGFIVHEQGQWRRAALIGGTELRSREFALRASGPTRGRVVAVDYARNAVVVDKALPEGKLLAGETVTFSNAKRHSAYRIEGAEKRANGWALVLGDAITELCRCDVAQVEAQSHTVRTETPILLYANGLEFPGMSLVNEGRTVAWGIGAFDAIGKTGVNTPPFGGTATVSGAADLKQFLTDANGDGRITFSVYDFGVGDDFELCNVAHLERLRPWAYRLQCTGPVTVSLPAKSARSAVWRRIGAGLWEAVSGKPSATAGMIDVSISPAESREVALVIEKPAWLNLADREPPTVRQALADGKPVADGATLDLGQIPELSTVTLEVADQGNPINLQSAQALLDGRLLPAAQVTCEPLTPDRKAVRVTVHLPPLKPEDLPGTQVLKVCRLVVRVSDEAIDSPPLERTLLYTLHTRPPANIVYLSDLQPKSVSAHTFSQDRGLNSVPIVLGGATYAKGLLTHPAISTPDNHAEVVYDLRNLHQYRRCRAVVGIEDVAGGGSAEFIVSTRTGQGEWQERWRSGVVKVGQPPRRADAALDGADELRLYCTDGGDGINCDHALWADAHLE